MLQRDQNERRRSCRFGQRARRKKINRRLSGEPQMPVGLLTLELHIPDAQSLKDKRQVLRSLKDKLRRNFNVAVAELEHHDTWQRSVVGVVTISNEEKHVNEVLQKVLDEADDILGSILINQAVEII
jgi:uncharacterized protein